MPTIQGWLYMARMVDRFTRCCVGWAMSDTLATSLPLAALDMAPKHRQPPAGLVHHLNRACNTPVQPIGNAWRQRA